MEFYSSGTFEASSSKQPQKSFVFSSLSKAGEAQTSSNIARWKSVTATNFRAAAAWRLAGR